MYIIKPTAAYRKSLKKLVRSGAFNISTTNLLINALASGAPLDPTYDNHLLHGEYAGCFECHIKGDLLLIYEFRAKVKEIVLIDIGSHSELFR